MTSTISFNGLRISYSFSLTLINSKKKRKTHRPWYKRHKPRKQSKQPQLKLKGIEGHKGDREENAEPKPVKPQVKESKHQPAPEATPKPSKVSVMLSRFSMINKPVKEEKPPKEDPYESVLQHAGSMGKYQQMLFMGLLPFGLFFAFVYFTQMIMTATPQKYWCFVPELKNVDMITRRNLIAPGAAKSNSSWDQCYMYAVNWTQVIANNQPLTVPGPNTPTVPCPNGWEFERTDVPYDTVVTERGWVCDKENYSAWAQAFFLAGAIAGGLLFAYIADRFGRILSLMGANLLGSIGSIGTIFSQGIWDFVICRFLVGMAFDNVFMTMYILVLEQIGTSNRSCVTNLAIALFFGAGCLFLPMLSLWLGDWKTLLWITSVPMLFIAAAPCILTESPRWLATRGRLKHAVAVLKNIGRINKKKIPKDVMDRFVESQEQANKKRHPTLMSLLRNRCLRNALIVMMVMYLVLSVIFDGLFRLVNAFDLNYVLMFTLSSLTEIPAALLLTVLLDKYLWFGRRSLTCVPMGIAGVLIITAIFVPSGIPVAILAIFSRFFLKMSYNTVTQWVTELLPTAVRVSGSSFMRITGFLSTMVSPVSAICGYNWYEVPLFILGAAALVGSIIGMMLPETAGKPMPQTVADGEEIIKEQPFLCSRDYKSHEDEPLPTYDVESDVIEPQPEPVKPVTHAKKERKPVTHVKKEHVKPVTHGKKSQHALNEPPTQFVVETEQVPVSKLSEMKHRWRLRPTKSGSTVMVIIKEKSEVKPDVPEKTKKST